MDLNEAVCASGVSFERLAGSLELFKRALEIAQLEGETQ